MVHTWSRIAAGRINDLDTSVNGDSEFFCPMDPGVISPWPAICPICNMDLVRRPKADALLLPSGVVSRMQFTPYRISLAGVKTAPVQPLESDGDAQNEAGSSATAKAAHFEVPVSSIVYWDRQSLVYAETMANMFDAVPVTILSRRGDQYIIEAPWTEPPRVAAIGTFLLDAETRLNPSLSTQYFGAAQNAFAAETPPAILQVVAKTNQGSSPEDQQLVAAQQVCPITKADLTSMGGPVFVDVQGRRVAICCEGCRGRLLATPEKYVQWFDEQLQQHHKATE